MTFESTGALRSAALYLAAGTHRIVWQVSGEIDTNYPLVFQDDRTGNVLVLRHGRAAELATE